MKRERVVALFFLAALFSVSFRGLRWQIAGLSPQLVDFLIVAFLLAFVADAIASRRHRPHRAVTIVLACAGALACAYIVGAAAIETRTGLVQLGKGLSYFVLHFAFLAAGVSYLTSRSARFYWVALACFLSGIGTNAGYAALQLLAAKAGLNLDAAVISPITGRTARSLSYGMANGPDVLRARGLTLDPNHLGVMLIIPVLVLTALTARLPELPWPRARAALLAALVLVQVATLSRSALVGLGAGVVFLGIHVRRGLLTRAIVVPAAGVVVALALVVAVRGDYFARVLSSRLNIDNQGRLQHLHVYELVGPALSEHPFFGVGLNNYALTYAPHVDGRVEASLSFYVQSLVETGIFGTALLVLFLAYVFHGLHVLHRIARIDGAPDALQFDALASALTAALVGTAVANLGYQTMSFSYFYAFLILAIAVPAMGVPALSAPVRSRGEIRLHELATPAPRTSPMRLALFGSERTLAWRLLRRRPATPDRHDQLTAEMPTVPGPAP